MEQRTQLERPFDRALVKTRRGPFGQALSYVEVTEYVRRLNEVLDGAWSYEIVRWEVRDAEVFVQGRLIAGDIIKEAFGGSTVTTSRETGEVISLADDLKSASSDCLKRAARLLGVGLDLYSSDNNQSRADDGPRRSRGGGTGNGNGNGTRQDRLTQRQLSAVWGLGRSLGLNAEQIRQRSVDTFGVVPEQLGKSDASSFISSLGEELNGGGG
jgi:hypothetical protein